MESNDNLSKQPKNPYTRIVLSASAVYTILSFIGFNNHEPYLSFPVSIPLFLCNFIGLRYDSLVGIFSMLAISTVIINLLTFFPVLIQSKFQRKQHFYLAQITVLSLYVLISIPCFISFFL